MSKDNVKLIDMVNACMVFIESHSNKLNELSLAQSVTSIKCLNSSNCSSIEIIDECENVGFIEKKPGYYYLTSIGKKVAKAQSRISVNLSCKVKKIILENVILNPVECTWDASIILSEFIPDTEFNTFIYKPPEKITQSIVKWIQVLLKLDFFIHHENLYLVNQSFLSMLNKYLLYKRERLPQVASRSDGNLLCQIGAFAESSAIEYEKRRLIRQGNEELAACVQQISKIDQSAGYDIKSFRGGLKDPDSTLFIEVKGTTESFPRFIWSKNERFIASKYKGSYSIYIYTNIDIHNRAIKGPIIINNPIENLGKNGFEYEPIDILFYKCK